MCSTSCTSRTEVGWVGGVQHCLTSCCRAAVSRYVGTSRLVIDETSLQGRRRPHPSPPPLPPQNRRPGDPRAPPPKGRRGQEVRCVASVCPAGCCNLKVYLTPSLPPSRHQPLRVEARRVPAGAQGAGHPHQRGAGAVPGTREVAGRCVPQRPSCKRARTARPRPPAAAGLSPASTGSPHVGRGSPHAPRAPTPHHHTHTLADDGRTTSVFWGYVLAAGIPSLVCAMLERSQMGLIFDLDETLLVAHSLNSVESRMDSCRRARCARARVCWADGGFGRRRPALPFLQRHYTPPALASCSRYGRLPGRRRQIVIDLEIQDTMPEYER